MCLKVLELFGGIGACTAALKRIGIPFEVVDYVEIDEEAVQSYNAINDTNFAPQDITKYDKKINVDLIMHGSPCQDFSNNGLNRGGDKGSGTRSSLMYETLRIVESLCPKYVVWENVPNILSTKHKHNFDAYCNEMSRLGYVNHYKILNLKDYGIPQNRKRIFCVSIRNDVYNGFTFPAPIKCDKTYRDYLQDDIDADTLTKIILTPNDLKKVKDFGAPYAFGGFIIKKDYYNTISASYGKISGNSGKIKYGDKYRILTTLEAWRLMGFLDEEHNKAKKVVNDKALYKQAGNSIGVNVLAYVFNELFREER